MRIIGGKFKGRALITLPDKTVRPTTDRVKESIYNLVQKSIPCGKVLDLFAGSGALGIEAISRGAEEVIFVDRARTSLQVVTENLKKVQGNYSIINKDYRAALDELSRKGKYFDVIFLDPPYGVISETEILFSILSANVLAEGGTIVLERSREASDYEMPDGLAIVDARDYGGTTIQLIKKATQVAITGTFDPFTLGHKLIVEEACKQYDIVHVVVLVNPEKEAFLSVEKRLKIIENATKQWRKQVKVAFFDGMTIDYCKRNGIKYIMRGIRNEKDAEYERNMAEYNLKEGGVETVFIQSALPEVSSTAVRLALQNHQDISSMVDDATITIITSEGKKKWQI